MSAPDASCACTMTAGDEYFPVPTMSREEKVFPAMTRLSISITSPALSTPPRAITPAGPALSAADEVDDLHLIAFADLDRFERPALEHHEIVLDRDAPRVDLEPRKQKTNGQRAGDLERIAVQSDLHVWNDHIIVPHAADTARSDPRPRWLSTRARARDPSRSEVRRRPRERRDTSPSGLAGRRWIRRSEIVRAARRAGDSCPV